MRTVTTRNAAQAIGNHEEFTTGGALCARHYEPGMALYADYGRLAGDDLEAFRFDRNGIVYVVFSYATPIAWVRSDGHKHVVSQRFSVTTSKHQSQLYLL